MNNVCSLKLGTAGIDNTGNIKIRNNNYDNNEILVRITY